MADFYGCLESTKFRVKNVEAFLADMDVQRLQGHAEADGFFEQDPATGYFAFGWYGQYPSTILSHYEKDGDEAIDTDITEVLERHILPGDVCQIGVSGNEKLRYIGGSLHWVTSKGTVYLDGTTEPVEIITEEALLERMRTLFEQTATVLGPEPGLRIVTGA